MPGMNVRYLECEASIEFGCGGLDNFLRRAACWRAEMMAHVLLKAQREMYVEHLYKNQGNKKPPAKGFDPFEALRRQFYVSAPTA